MSSLMLFTLLMMTTVVTGQEDYWRVCYYTNWAQYRPDPATFFPENIDVNLCSHLIYAFADMDENVLIPYEPNDFEMYGRINDLKQINPELKTLLAVGGWTFGTSKMTLMMSSEENRTEFIDTSIEYLRTHQFDGFDLDFEYPGSRGSPPEDKEMFTILIQELRLAFEREALLTGNPKLILSIAVPGGPATIDAGYEIEPLCAQLDKVNIMSYDLNGAWENDTGIHAPLYVDTNGEQYDLTRSVRYAAEYWVAGGCPRDKLIIGMPMYGRGWTMHPFNPDRSIGSLTIGKSKAFNYSLTDGIATYSELCRDFLPMATKEWDDTQQGPFAYFEDQWFGYDNVQSLTLKTQWLKQAQFAGWMIWSLDQDDFNGAFCGVTYPLLKALNLALLGYLPGEQTTAAQAIPPPDLSFCSDNEHTSGDHPDPATCTRFYRCIDQYTYSYECPAGLLFDPSQNVCEWPDNIDPVYRCQNCEPEYCPVEEVGAQPIKTAGGRASENDVKTEGAQQTEDKANYHRRTSRKRGRLNLKRQMANTN